MSHDHREATEQNHGSYCRTGERSRAPIRRVIDRQANDSAQHDSCPRRLCIAQWCRVSSRKNIQIFLSFRYSFVNDSEQTVVCVCAAGWLTSAAGATSIQHFGIQYARRSTCLRTHIERGEQVVDGEMGVGAARCYCRAARVGCHHDERRRQIRLFISNHRDTVITNAHDLQWRMGVIMRIGRIGAAERRRHFGGSERGLDGFGLVGFGPADRIRRQ